VALPLHERRGDQTSPLPLKHAARWLAIDRSRPRSRWRSCAWKVYSCGTNPERSLRPSTTLENCSVVSPPYTVRRRWRPRAPTGVGSRPAHQTSCDSRRGALVLGGRSTRTKGGDATKMAFPFGPDCSPAANHLDCQTANSTPGSLAPLQSPRKGTAATVLIRTICENPTGRCGGLCQRDLRQ